MDSKDKEDYDFAVVVGFVFSSHSFPQLTQSDNRYSTALLGIFTDEGCASGEYEGAGSELQPGNFPPAAAAGRLINLRKLL
jgi:hypothetical protein